MVTRLIGLLGGSEDISTTKDLLVGIDIESLLTRLLFGAIALSNKILMTRTQQKKPAFENMKKGVCFNKNAGFV